MFTDPIELPCVLDSVEVAASGHVEKVFRIADVGPSSSRRVNSSPDYSTEELVIRNQFTDENKSAGFQTTRTAIGIYVTSSSPTQNAVKASVNVTMSIPIGTAIVRETFAQQALVALFSFLLNSEDTTAADQSRASVASRLSRILAGEP